MDDYIAKPIRTAVVRKVLARFFAPDQAGEQPAPSPVKETEPRVLNPENLLDISGSDPEMIEELIGEFMRDAPRYLAELEDVLMQGNQDYIYQQAHRLKGLLANAGGERLCAQLTGIGTRAREGSLIPDTVDFSSLKEELRALQEALEKMDWNALCSKGDP